MPDATQDFFESPTENSRVKAKIVAKYVQTWARVMSDYLRSQRRSPEVAYVDMFCGPGTYEDGTPSTPMLILAAAVRDPKLTSALRTYFNDRDAEAVASLSSDIAELPGLDNLAFRPELRSDDATLDLVSRFRIPPGAPRLFFLDQFGYKHVTLEMISHLLEGFGSECIFFFNYRRVIAAVDNPAMTQNVRLLFGNIDAVSDLRQNLRSAVGAVAREQILLLHLISALKRNGAVYVQPFSFRLEDHHRSTHHLIFVTKHPRGYSIMRDIMAREGTPSADGVPVMSYIQKVTPQTASLFATDPIQELANVLTTMFAGKTLSVDEIFLQHSGNTNYMLANYKAALLRLEADCRITTSPIAKKRPIRAGQPTMAGTTLITFSKGDK